MAKITSKEIAKLAGVSASTVSLVLNNEPGVGDSTRKRIIDILSENGIPLKPNKVQTKESILFCKIVKHGRIVNEKHTKFISDYIDGVLEEAKSRHLHVELVNFDFVPIEEIVLDIQNTAHIKGCIILATELSVFDCLLFSKLSIPYVFIDAFFNLLPANCISMDNKSMVHLAIKHFVSKGHRKIGLLYSDGCNNFAERVNGFKESLEELGITYNQNYIFKLTSTNDVATDEMFEILSERPKETLPTAFFACNDIIAIGAMRAMEKIGLRIPEDISIIGFDDLAVSSIVSPPLTTINVPKRAIGKSALRILAYSFNLANKASPEKGVLCGYLVERSSVKDLRKKTKENLTD